MIVPHFGLVIPCDPWIVPSLTPAARMCLLAIQREQPATASRVALLTGIDIEDVLIAMLTLQERHLIARA